MNSSKHGQLGAHPCDALNPAVKRRVGTCTHQQSSSRRDSLQERAQGHRQLEITRCCTLHTLRFAVLLSRTHPACAPHSKPWPPVMASRTAMGVQSASSPSLMWTARSPCRGRCGHCIGLSSAALRASVPLAPTLPLVVPKCSATQLAADEPGQEQEWGDSQVAGVRGSNRTRL